MGWFGKKNKQEISEDALDDIDYEKEKSELRDNLRFRRKLRDLNPENKKLRKEPIKPWGKTERLIVGGTFLTMALISGLLAFTASGYRLPKLPNIKIDALKFNHLNPFREQVISTRGLRDDKLNQFSQEILNRFVSQSANLSGKYAFYFLDIKSDSRVFHNSGDKMIAASLIKLPVMYSFYKEASLGKQNLDDKYVLKNTDKIKGSGSLYLKPSGTILTYRDLLRLMGKESDNTAYNIIRKKVGDDVIFKYMHNLSMNSTSISENITTAEDVSKVIKAINSLSDRERKEITSFLTLTIYEDVLPKDLPKVVNVWHKFGKETGVINDAGIISYNNKNYISVLLSQNIIDSEAYGFLSNFSKFVYEESIKLD